MMYMDWLTGVLVHVQENATVNGGDDGTVERWLDVCQKCFRCLRFALTSAQQSLSTVS